MCLSNAQYVGFKSVNCEKREIKWAGGGQFQNKYYNSKSTNANENCAYYVV